MENTKPVSTLKKRLARLEERLEQVRGKEYEQPFGSMRRAKISRSWDELAKAKMRLLQEIERETE